MRREDLLGPPALGGDGDLGEPALKGPRPDDRHRAAGARRLLGVEPDHQRAAPLQHRAPVHREGGRARSLLRRAAGAWQDDDGPCPRTAERLFALADAGHSRARDVVGRHAADVGRLAAAATAVLDPGLIVLGGDVGSNPQLLPGVRAELARLSWPTEVASSALGDSGTVGGATELAVARGIQTVTERVPVKH